jgi:putative glutamine amidotransferase
VSARPRIGVSTSAGRGRLLWWLVRFALWRQNAESVRLFPGREYPIDWLDGVIVGGGDDISPTLYAGELDPAIRLDPERDQLELRILDHALARPLPVLGICRGSQMINVHRGGTLHEEIRIAYPHAPRRRTPLPRKGIHVLANTRLKQILGCDLCRVNALHHQAIDRLGEGLRIAARDEHGMVQAVEGTDGHFLIGVQWHPEFLLFDRGQQRLFQRLVSAAGAGDGRR